MALYQLSYARFFGETAVTIPDYATGCNPINLADGNRGGRWTYAVDVDTKSCFHTIGHEQIMKLIG